MNITKIIPQTMENTMKILGFEDLPERLREIPDPPRKLYIRGDNFLNKDMIFLCVIGSRKCSQYGKLACEKLISGLSDHKNIVIVSGLALGIDSVAHKSALEAGLLTIALPGSGLNDDVLYPRTNCRLAEEILRRGGALVSEFSPDTVAAPWCFPQRNRIMAGISHAILIIEGELQSGSLITCRLATDYNRDVFAVPGSIFSSGSEGPHQLIRMGALLIRSSDDILDAFGLKKVEVKQKNYDNFSPNEKTIIEILKESLPRDIVIRNSPLSVSETNMTLSLLEMKGLIREMNGEIFLCLE